MQKRAENAFLQFATVPFNAFFACKTHRNFNLFPDIVHTIYSDLLV